MNFLKFLQRETDRPLHRVLIMAAISGIANAALLAIINASAHAADGQGSSFKYLVMFGATITAFVLGQNFIFRESTLIIEEILDRIRRRLSDLIRKTSLIHLDEIGRSAIYNRLTQETTTVSTSAWIIISSLQAGIMLIFVAIYIMIKSKIAFFLIIILLITAIFYYLSNHKKLQVGLMDANKEEMQLFESLTDILEGIKEIKLNNRRSDGVYNNLSGVSQRLRGYKINTGVRYFNNLVFAQSFYYFLIAVIIFVLPKLYPTYSESLTELTAAILFMIGPVGAIVGAIQSFDQVDFAIGNIYKLEAALTQALEHYPEQAPRTGPLKTGKFEKITMKGVYFAYNDKVTNDTFSIGPIDLEFNKGETVFIVGGNGSGKTTFLKVLTTLYHHKEGSLYLDKVLIDESNAVDFRQLFSAVYSEFHLFSRLYGLDEISADHVQELLELMEIDNKTQFQGDRFSTQDLSAGQRKRLALLISLMEDKPIYVLDEWAADQDPEFRKFFYDTLLVQLKQQGKTVIAASHDDRYFKYADRIIKMDYGQIAEDSAHPELKNYPNNHKKHRTKITKKPASSKTNRGSK